MKLKLPVKYGQRDSKWASILLGYNSSIYTIGGYGCLITSLGNYVGKTPQEINNILKDNGGFTAGSGNFIWSKCSVLGLTQIYASPKYDGPVTSQGITKMKALLDEGRPLLTHVDFNPNTAVDDQHWLMVTGYEGDNFFAFDPWSGTDISLDVYGGVVRAVIEFKAYDKILNKEGNDALAECLNQHTILVDKCNDKDKEIKNLQDKIVDLENQIREKDKNIVDLTFNSTQWKNTSQAYEVQNFTELDAKIRAMNISNLEDYMLITEHEESVKTLKDQLELKYSLKEKKILDNLTTIDLLRLLLGKFKK